MPHTPYEFHDTRRFPINDPTAKIDFIILCKNGQQAIRQVRDRYMEVLKQQRQRKFVFCIVLD
ncbi:2026_t:CDS:2 [Funneliformis geosporum]|nr:2026_t:CDS:2 [Funneliformis geosporum]